MGLAEIELWLQNLAGEVGKLAFSIGRDSGKRSSGRMGGDSFAPSSALSPDEDELFAEDFELDSMPEMMGGESDQRPSWIEPNDLKLMHRIGRGLFGDVWLATLHNSTEEFDEFHEVVVKMLPLISDEKIRTVLGKFETLYEASQGLNRVSWPRGMSTKDGKVSINHSSTSVS